MEKVFCQKCGKEMMLIMDEYFGQMFICECGECFEKEF